MTILILSRGKCALSKCTTRYLIAMASADLMVVVVVVILEKCNYIYLFASFLLQTPECAVILVLNVAITGCSVWFTVGFTFDRYIALCCQNLRNQYCNEKTATVVITIVFAGSCAKGIPFYFAVDPWRCVAAAEYFTSPIWKAYEVFDSITTPLLPIFLILLFNILTVRRIVATNRARRQLRSNNDKQNDLEVENRRKSMILLFALSANFILLWMPYLVQSMTWQNENYSNTDKYFSTPLYILQQFGFMLKFLSSCTNTCIYGLTQRKFREELKNGMKYLFTLNGQI
ncbi:probable G-protein coupled receptor 139 [Hemitrygon akajei]|uniref:probable G-protein coupled receptor 139 n=1 Tax=Hemitrygon akajei TaxID=2704970 RepID=UPI003BFA0537